LIDGQSWGGHWSLVISIVVFLWDLEFSPAAGLAFDVGH
jgi:hypothetical protein